MTSSEKSLREEIGLDMPGAGCKNYSVKAGAGGGKTTLLSHRIVNQIIKGIPIEEFVIITYTNAAATELREKITNRLQVVVDSGKLAEGESKNAREALNSIELMQISTIHAFLFKILKEYAFEAGIAMDAKMLEDTEDAARKKKFFDKWYHEHFDEIEAFKDDWVTVSSNGFATEHHRDVFENMFNDVANVRENIIFDVSDHTALIESCANTYVLNLLPDLIRVRDAIKKNIIKPDKNARKLNKEADIVIAKVDMVETTSVYDVAVAQEISEAIKAIVTIVSKGKNIYSKCSDIFADIESTMMAIYAKCSGIEAEWNFSKYYDLAINAQKAAKVAEYVCKIQKEYQKEIDAETSVLSNDDILYRAEKLLLEHTDILEKIRNRYSKIYVDEFQDTTGLQTCIIKLLSEKNGASLAKIDLADDKLLVVGDSKQSIYRFTGAEKAVYENFDKMIDALPTDLAESVNLESNFRSNSEIVDWVNNSFDGSATGSSDGLMTDYTKMATDWRVTQTEALHGVYRYDNPSGPCSKKDVANVVSLVKTLVNDPRYFIERVSRNEDGEIGAPVLNEIQYSDIMIICKNTTHMDAYVNAFAKEGIPVNVQGKFKVNEDEVLRNYVLLAEYFAAYKNKKNRITAVQIIRGIDVSKVDDGELHNAEEELRNLRLEFKRANLNVASVAQQLLSHEELFVPKGKFQEVERVRSYRIRLHQMVETCLGKNTGDLSEFVSIMKDYLETDVKREIPLESNENAIRLMNAHQSKGLTGQIVIIADRSANEECRYSAFRKDGKYYPAASYKNSNSGESKTVTIPTYGYDIAMLKLAYTEETEEAIRLQYVAATRAAHALIIMPVATSRNTPWFTDMAFDLPKKPNINDWINDRNQDTNSYSVISSVTSARHQTIKLEDLTANLAGASLTSLSEVQATSITPSGLESSGVTGYDVKDAKYVKESRPGGNIFGTVMHRAYELILNRYTTISRLSVTDREKTIERIINQAILEQTEELRTSDDPKEFMAFLKPIMLDYMTKVISPIVTEAAEIYPEYTFSFYVPDCERVKFLKDFDRYFKAIKDMKKIGNEDLWINGQADLVVKKKDGTIKVYDYKSDAMNGKSLADFEEALARKYEGQLELYKYAIGKAFGVNSVETELIHLYR